MSGETNEPSVREQRVNEVIAAYLEAVDAGETPDPKEFTAAHDDIAAELESFFANRDEFERMAEPLQPGGSEAPMPQPDDPTLPPTDEPTEAPTLGPTETAGVAIGTMLRYFGDYELLDEIARGGMGVVYKARQVSLNRSVALKMILAGQLASEDDVKRFHAEAEAAANLDHPGIVPIYEVGEHEGQHYFSMGFVEGNSLSAKVADGPLPPKKAAEYTKKVAEAVAFAHQHGVIHRDLKPANVLLDGNDQPKVTDFGLAKKVEGDDGLTATGQILGTPGYMPPEQASGKIDEVTETADLYSLGAILYNLLTARPPFQADNPLDTLMQVLEREPASPRTLNPKVPQDLETICLKCLEKDRHRRYASAQELADELDRFLSGRPILARPIGAPGRAWRWCKRRPIVAGLSAAVAVLVLFVAIGSPIVAVRQTTLRQVADTRAEEARLAGEQARLAREKTEVTLVDMYTSAGLVAGEPAQAVLWFANAARLAGTDPQRERANRIRVRTWSRQVPTPVRALGHDGRGLRSIQFHAEGKHLVTLTDRDKCIVWDLESERPVPLPGGDRPVRSVAFSPDGRWLALGLPQGNVEIVSFPDGEPLYRIEHRGPVAALAFSRDGNRLAMASEVVRVWDCQSHEYATPELVHPRQVIALAFSASGDRLATGCEDNTARVFAITGQSAGAEPLFPPVPHRLKGVYWITPIAPTFIDQDRGLLTVTDTTTVAWRDAETGEQIRPVPAEAGTVNFLAVSPDGRHFALGGWVNASLWDVATGRRVGNQTSQPDFVLSATFSPDGTTLITGSANNVRPWSVPAGEPAGPVLRHQGGVHHTAFSPDGKLVATAQYDGLVRVWSTPQGNHPDQRLPLDGTGCSARLSCDGCYLIATGSSWFSTNLPWTRVFDAKTFQPAGPPLRPGGILTGADLSPDGRHAVTLNSLGQAHFWDWSTGERPFDPVAMPSEPRAVRYTSDGRRAIVACSAGQVLVIDPATGQVTRRLQHGTVPRATAVERTKATHGYLDVSFDGRRFLSCSIDKLVRVWDAATGRPCYRPLQHEKTALMARFSPDARLLLTTAGSTVRTWDATTGAPLGSALAHPNVIFDACFSPDGQYVLTACGDGMARLWDWRTGAMVCPPFQHAERVSGVGFTPDGIFVLTASLDSTARVWEWHTGKPVTPPLSISGKGQRVITTFDGTHAFVSGGASFIDVFSLGDLCGREEMELDDLCTLGEIVSGQRLHEGGDVVNLTADEWLDRWRRFRQRYPEYFRLDWPPEQIIAWHGREADKNRRSKQWSAAVWHLDRLIAREREDWRLYRDRSRAYRALGQTEAADADQARASALMPTETVLALLESRSQKIAQASPQQQQKTLADLKAHLAAKAESGLEKEDVRWAMATAESIQRSAGSELAASTYQSFAEVIGKSEYESSVDIAKKMQGIARRLVLVGNEIEFQGTKLDGSPLDAAAYQGKVVLVDFWTTWCPHCWPEITNTKKNYQLYHDRGFEVVAVSLDEDRQKLEQYLQKDPLLWSVVHTEGAGWKHPMAVHYGIASVPTMFLVGQNGKVVSNHVRGQQLDKLLEQLLGPRHGPQGRLSYVDLESKANRRLDESTSESKPENHLGEVPKGEQMFGGVKFRIGDRLIQLGSEKVSDKPEKVEGIEIKRNLTTLYILHGTQDGGTDGGLPDHTLIGKYEVNYSDATKETIPIVYGEDVRNWWNNDQPVSRGRVVWKGSNPRVRARNLTLRLYLTKWTNPRPDKEVTSVDYVSTNTIAAPFCVAMTAEQESTSAQPRGPVENLINDPSLEGAELGEQFPPGWGSFNAKPKGTYRFEVVEGGRTGTKSCLIEGDGEGITMPTNRVSIDPSKRYAGRGWVKLEGNASSAQVRILYFDASRRYIGENRRGHVTPHAEWQLVTVTDRIEDYPNAQYLALAMAVKGRGKAVFDDLELLAFNTDDLPGNFEAEYGRTVPRESRVLDRWLGQWESKTTYKPTDASAEADETVGIRNVAKILDDHVLQSHWISDDGDEEILSLLVYDNKSAAYRLWTFSSSVAALEFIGQWDDATSTMTLQLVPSTSGVTGTSTTRFVDADTIETRLIVKNKEGVVTRDMQETLTRKSEKAAVDVPPWMGTSALSPELKPLQRFIGSWDGQFVVNSAEWTSEKTTAPLTHKVEWILGGRMIRHRFVLSPPVDSHGLTFMACNPEGNVYRRWDFDSGGGFPRGEDGETLGKWAEATQTFTWKYSAPNGETSTATNRFIDSDTHDWTLVSKDSTGEVLLDMESKAKRK